MKTSSKTCCVYLIFLTLKRGAFSSDCGFSNFSETLKENEFGYINVSHTTNAKGSSDCAELFLATYEVCEKNSSKLKSPCSFFWKQHQNNMNGRDVSRTAGVICVGEQRNVSNSVVAVDIHISQVVTRSLSAMIISTGRGGIPKSTRVIRVEVLYPPQVKSLTVDGQEAKGTHLINEGQKVNVSCSFVKGNPPVTFSLVDNKGKELVRGSGPLTYLLSVHCEDDWPTVRCEANGSDQNISVSFLATCPPMFTEKSLNIVSSPPFNITLPVKAYTKEVVDCLLTSMTLEDNTTITLNCTLTGHPPNLTLFFHLRKENNSIHGVWTLILVNNRGPANITLNFTTESRMRFKTESEDPAQTPVREICIGGTCGAVLIVVIAIIAFRATKKVTKNKPG